MASSRARRRTSLGLALCAVLLCSSPVAAAPKLQGTGETAVGYTDNVQTTPASPLVAGAPRSRGAFLTLSPGVVLALESPRNIQRIRYRYEYDFFFAQTDTSSSTNQIDYQGFFELSQRVTLTLGASASETNRYAALAFAAPGTGAVSALPAGAGAYVQGGANQSLNFDVAPRWRAWQTTSVTAAAPILGTDAPETTEVGARAGVERSFSLDAVGAEARGIYTVVDNGVQTDGTRAPTQEQLVTSALGLWRRDWGRYLTSSAEAGVARVQRFNTGRGFWSPTGSAVLSYADVSGDAQLSYAHNISSNALLGQSLLADEIRLRGALPLTAHDELLIAVTAGYQNGRLIDENAALAAHVAIGMGDIALGWRATDALELALRYQHIEQKSDALVPPLPLSFVQNSVLLGAILKFPPDRDMPRPYRAPVRVDRSDEIREGFPTGLDMQHQTSAPSSGR